MILLFRSISFSFAALCFLSLQAIIIGEMKLGTHTMEEMKIQEHFVVIQGELARTKSVGEMEGVLEQSRVSRACFCAFMFWCKGERGKGEGFRP